MKIAIVNSFDALGGAARAASRLHRALGAAGADSSMLVAQRDDKDRSTLQLGGRVLGRALRFADRLRARIALFSYRHTRGGGYEAFQLDRPLFGRLLERQIPAVNIINLHWVAGMLDFRSLPQLAVRAPIVWTLHDMLPMTGGCHYDDDCARYLQHCGACPQLGSSSDHDLSAAIFGRRRQAFDRIARERLHFVSPSRWLAGRIERSPLCGRFPVSVIPNSLDVQLFAPSDRARARAALDLPQDRVIVMFAAEDVRNRRKGMHLLIEALARLRDLSARLLLVSVGRAQAARLPGFEQRHFPHAYDDRHLASIYSAADVLVIPSLQDNLPNTMLEAMACGTPVAGFGVGGIPDMVRDGDTGIVVPPGSVHGLDAALRRIAGSPDEARAMGRRARELVLAECAPAVQARRYLELFERVMRGAAAPA